MKKLTFITLSILLAFTSCTKEEPVAFANLPAQAQTILNTYFSDMPVALTKTDNEGFAKVYEVIFTTGDRIEFDRDGDWREIEMSAGVPMELIPQPIVDYLKANYPTQVVIMIDYDKYNYELELDNLVELKFNTKYQLIDIDIKEEKMPAVM